ncbi:MAG: glycosyltransferase family 2 protein [Bryobacterales bacterium]|nr:glycosyltransferase family 2 protein [Bryobacterales bacterium]
MHQEILQGWRIEAASGEMLDCSLVVPTYRRPREIVRLLDALPGLATGNSPELPREVVIVDGSPDRDVEDAVSKWAAGRALPFTLCYVRCPAGLTRQRNAGIDASTAPCVVFLDDDAIPCAGFFREICAVFDGDPDHCIGGVAGCVVNELNSPMSWRWRLRYWLGLAPSVEPMHYHPSGTSAPSSRLRPFLGVRPVDLLPGCCFALRRDVFSRHRFSAFFHGYSQGEDMEMSLRVGQDWYLVSCGDARAFHYPAPGGRPHAFSKGQMEVRNRYFIWKRHVPRPALVDRARFWLDIAFCVAFDFGAFLLRPWHVHRLSHALGLIWGAIQCRLHPPIYAEPRPEQQFAIAWRRLCSSQNPA